MIGLCHKLDFLPSIFVFVSLRHPRITSNLLHSHVVQDDIKFLILLTPTSVPSNGITGIHYNRWFKFSFYGRNVKNERE